jgi:hypothetical protein
MPFGIINEILKDTSMPFGIINEILNKPTMNLKTKKSFFLYNKGTGKAVFIMYSQEQELQLISVERDRLDSYRIGSVQNRASLRRKRRRRQQRRRLLRSGILCLTAIALLAICFQTNWIANVLDTSFVDSLPKKIRKLEKKVKKEQKEYPMELLEALEQNEEMYDFAENYTNREEYQGKAIDLSDSYETGSVPLLMQWDKRWGYDSYGDAMIGLAGCGPTCMAMAYLYFTDDLGMNPRKMAEYAQDGGYHSEEGTSWSFWTEGANGLGLTGEQIPLSEDRMKAVLDQGGLVVCSMAPGDFTTTGHFILLRGYDVNGFLVNDPNRKKNSQRQWDYETLSGQIKNLWAVYGRN